MLLFHCKSKRSHFRCHKGLGIAADIGENRNLWNASNPSTPAVSPLWLHVLVLGLSLIVISVAVRSHLRLDSVDKEGRELGLLSLAIPTFTPSGNGSTPSCAEDRRKEGKTDGGAITSW